MAACMQVVVKPTGTTRNTVDQVNAVAPTYQVSKVWSLHNFTSGLLSCYSRCCMQAS